jgi:hypothetical protein
VDKACWRCSLVYNVFNCFVDGEIFFSVLPFCFVLECFNRIYDFFVVCIYIRLLLLFSLRLKVLYILAISRFFGLIIEFGFVYSIIQPKLSSNIIPDPILVCLNNPSYICLFF